MGLRLLKTLGECPPEPTNFSYFHSETKHRSGPFRDYYSLVQAYKEHRNANGLPIPQNYHEVIQEQICSVIPPELCTYQHDGVYVNIHLSISDVVNFMKVLWAQMKGRSLVDQSEADRRAKICASCYLNVRVAGCGACAQLVELVTPNRSTPYDNELKNCAVCHCYNQAQVWFPVDVLANSDTSDRQNLYPEFCWKKKTSPNYQEN